MKSNEIVDQENQILLHMGSSNYTSVSTTELTSTNNCLQGLFLQYLQEAVISILCLRHFYEGISTTVHLRSSLLPSLRCEIMQPSLRASLRSKILQPSLIVSLRSGILLSSLLASLRICILV